MAWGRSGFGLRYARLGDEVQVPRHVFGVRLGKGVGVRVQGAGCRV